MRTPTHLSYGEGRVNWEAIDARTRSVRRGMWHGTLEGDTGNRGRPVLVGVRNWRRTERESDRVVRPTKLGNAGGGKGPDFWCALEDSEDVVIGNEPQNT